MTAEQLFAPVKGEWKMSATEELFDLSRKREKIIQRIMDLSEDQIDRLIASQQETESYQICPAPHRTSA